MVLTGWLSGADSTVLANFEFTLSGIERAVLLKKIDEPTIYSERKKARFDGTKRALQKKLQYFHLATLAT